MSKRQFCTHAIICSLLLVTHAHAHMVESTQQVEEFFAPLAENEGNEEHGGMPNMAAQASSTQKVIKKKISRPFAPFTGKVRGNRVRLRLKADTDSQIIREVNKGELFEVVGEDNEFYAVTAPADAKAYIFRTYVLNNTVEGNHVNVRLSPDLDAPVLAHLNQGEHVDGALSETNPKWFEVKAPKSVRFFIAKDLVENVGSLDLKKSMDTRKETAEALYESSLALSGKELDRPFEEIDLERINSGFKTIINDYQDLPAYVEKAKEALAAIQEAHTQKKISFLQLKSSRPMHANISNAAVTYSVNEKMGKWKGAEEGLFLQWASNNPASADTIDEFYMREKASAVPLTGVIEAYGAPVKNKPGDYILRENDLPVAYLYSTQINLDNYVGKRVALQALPRPNNNFAFPAYFVVDAQ